MRELASLRAARAFFREIGALPDMLLVAVQAAVTVAKHRKVAADPLTCADVHMRERAVLASTAALVEEVKTEWRAFRRRVVREGAAVRGTGAVAL